VIQDRDIPTDRTVRARLGADAPPSGAEDGPIALIRAVIRAVRRRKLPLAIWVSACVVVAFFYARSQPPVYTTSSVIILEPPRQSGGFSRDTTITSLDLNRVDSELQVIRSERLQAQVFNSLGLIDLPELGPQPPSGMSQLLSGITRIFGGGGGSGASPPADDAQPFPAPSAVDQAWREAFAKFQSRFSARRIGQSYVIEISYSSSDPEISSRVANSAASAYLLQSVAFKAAAASGGAEFVQGRVDALSAQVEDAADAVRRGVLPEGQMPDADGRVIGAALRPLSPSAPRPKLIIAMGGVLGLMSGLFVIAIATALDRSVRSGARLTRETGIACLASVPEGRRAHQLTAIQRDALVTSQPRSPFALAIRDLRTSINLASAPDLRKGNRVIALVAWGPDVGCSMLCMNLAHLMQANGRIVTVVDGDVEGSGRGLTARYALSGPSPEHGTLLDANGIALLPATELRVRVSTFADLRDPAMAELLDFAKARGDVLLDLPPLSESADAKALARHADTVIIVAAAHTSVDDIREAEYHIRSVGVNIIGAIVNRAET
jgi:succinoglycan biosynthesis transport protein ExoP